MDSSGPLPLAALSLHALGAAPAGLGASLLGAARPVKVAPPLVSARDGVRSHPITAVLTTSESSTGAADSSTHAQGPHALQRLVTAVPAALARLVTAPFHQHAFNSPASLSDMRVFPSPVPKRAAPGGGARPAGGAGRKAALVWFRNDLRLHDNPALEQACRQSSSVLPVYVFDPRDYGKTPSGFDRTGPGRARFLLEAVADLRQRLRDAGSDLVVRLGRPEAVLRELAAAVGAGAVYCQSEVTAEEMQVEGRVRAALDREGCELRPQWGGTLFHLEDLPFRLDAMPTSYADFRERVAALKVRQLAESEGGVKGLPAGNSVEPGDIPTLQRLGFSPAAATAGVGAGAAAAGSGLGAPLQLGGGAAVVLRGGESEALRHMQSFIDELKRAVSAAATAGGKPGSAAPPSATFSCRISPWLALGCLSPRRMYHEMRQQLAPTGAPVIRTSSSSSSSAAAPLAAPAKQGGTAGVAGSTSGSNPANWLVFELLWRDFFRFVTQKHSAGARLAAAKAAARGGRSAAVTVAPAAPAMAAALA
ncbi:hypothetical protein HYH02_001563 [Chlamydomonas schloesseri]|uniref:Photolyase/cryptochrome alpha/beta domain-containing protein n=1 Tax=Chlamydomonas schloesseri TaxID=2026947 RepID=A0A836BC02_9CHLO|nr:hypothetical protein HYH02_001563 [Chlamydomonas schloesseri]|eukprot:KAG2453339.1 hypothetical protein HYH02_001563 [Chlamydomonas schloesseri]